MNFRAHWTPSYIIARGREMLSHFLRPGRPWLTQEANSILENLLRPGDIGVEFGSGRSTLWFAKRVAKLYSIEHDREWHAKVSAMLRAEAVLNVNYSLCADSLTPSYGLPGYVSVLSGLPPATVDFVLVDGLFRDVCALSALEYLRPGGVLIVDNVNWFLPSASNSPDSVGPGESPRSDLWRKFFKDVKGWRVVWTSNGVSDTAFYFKP